MMKHPTSRLLYEYWNEVRGDRAAPRRLEIEPARLAAILPDTFILERIGEMDVRYRLAGTRIGEQFRTELRGESFFNGFVLTDRRVLQRIFRGMINEPCGTSLSVTSSSPSGRRVTHECLILPLTHMTDTVDRFVGCLTLNEHPLWLGDEPLVEHTLSAHQRIVTSNTTTAADQEPPALDPHVRVGRIVRQDRRYFRVYEGGLTGRDDPT